MDLINARKIKHSKICAVIMFHFRALNERLNLRNKTNNYTCIKYDVSHINNYQHNSIHFAIIILTIIVNFLFLVLF